MAPPPHPLTQHTFPENMSPADNSTSTPTPISLSASARLPLLARNPGAPSLTYPSLAPRRAMHQVPFVPRPFPPPALADVPLEYIIDQLRRLAPHYWSRPETSDCTIGMCSALLSSSQTISHFTVRQLCLWTTRVLIRCQHLPVCAMRSATWTSVPRCLRICMDSRTLLGAPLGSL